MWSLQHVVSVATLGAKKCNGLCFLLSEAKNDAVQAHGCISCCRMQAPGLAACTPLAGKSSNASHLINVHVSLHRGCRKYAEVDWVSSAWCLWRFSLGVREHVLIDRVLNTCNIHSRIVAASVCGHRIAGGGKALSTHARQPRHTPPAHVDRL